MKTMKLKFKTQNIPISSDRDCHCEYNEAISLFSRRLPRTLQVLAMTYASSNRFVYRWIWDIVILSAIFCLLSTVFGCGYTLHGKASLPFQAIHIGIIENRTVEPKLQDKLYKALTDEFLKQGIAVYHGADHQIEGRIDQFELRILSETSDVATEYEVIMKGNFTITDSSGHSKEIKDIGSPFIISFSGSGHLTELLAVKELASDRAVRDMASEIVATLIYR